MTSLFPTFGHLQIHSSIRPTPPPPGPPQIHQVRNMSVWTKTPCYSPTSGQLLLFNHVKSGHLRQNYVPSSFSPFYLNLRLRSTALFDWDNNCFWLLNSWLLKNYIQDWMAFHLIVGQYHQDVIFFFKCSESCAFRRKYHCTKCLLVQQYLASCFFIISSGSLCQYSVER